jgi:type II secretory pathway predicted ATPase ExeA
MYLKYWGFKEKPFENTPDPRFLYRSAHHEEALMRMIYCIKERKGAAMLTGEYGSGKTVLTRALLKELLRNDTHYKAALIVNPSFSSEDFLREIIFQLDNKFIEEGKLRLIHTLNEILYRSREEGKDVVVIVDEAQIIKNDEMFEELRLLLNFQMNDRFLLTLLLVGQPELRRKINSISQLKQRLAIVYHLTGLDKEEVTKYIDYRCKVAGKSSGIFSKSAIKRIADYTAGVPRKINTVCELALLQGMFEKKKTIDTMITEKILEEVYL